MDGLCVQVRSDLQCCDAEEEVQLQVHPVTAGPSNGNGGCDETDHPGQEGKPGDNDNPRMQRMLEGLRANDGEVGLCRPEVQGNIGHGKYRLAEETSSVLTIPLS